ncbi:tRNA 5-methylaminomethyl-2-thiouridine synthase TusB [Photobacterium marinum]|uniref:tRNA 5-methylaminomethyl-2-thiouridine synthase TusB n=1 Tax=Photobacterium marinum TaxID=1056511 RepID=L8J4V9_9GAMM|nr:sulfurtransferase complex subunit TusB [Photobacterium marinum]ELR63905.1 tRNA 5-methylaminomethyl-2-thiouridine synthase TusB [Photobacterium marinum]
MLHTITTSPFQTQALQRCLRYIGQGDEILLIQDAVIAGIEKNAWAETLKQSGVKIYLLEADLAARGIAGKTDNSLEVVDFNGFASLTVKHETQMKWA